MSLFPPPEGSVPPVPGDDAWSDRCLPEDDRPALPTDPPAKSDPDRDARVIPYGAVTYGEQALARRIRIRELMARRARLDREIVRLQREANGFESLALVERHRTTHPQEEPVCPERLPE